MDGSGWCLIESDPGVFTELIRDFGVKDVQWVSEPDPRPVAEDYPTTLFFAHQTIQNACATQAILSVLLNSRDVDLGSELTTFRDFVADFPPSLRGEAISNSDRIRAVHNGFSRLDVFDDKVSSGTAEDAFHFISYVPHNGRLYELDGLKQAPYDLGACPEGDWLAAAAPHIEARMQRYASSELRFALMAVTRDPRVEYRKELDDIALRLTDPALAQDARDALTRKESELMRLMAVEDEVAEAQVAENARRKHNWYPLIYNLLRLMAEEGQLSTSMAKP